MTENWDDEQTLKNRIILREATIKKLTTKYLDLVYKFNTFTRSEIAQLIREILNEIEMIEISIGKAENLEKLKEIDSKYQKSLLDEISRNSEIIKKEITECVKKLLEAKNEKEYKMHFEEIARVINSYDTKEVLQERIYILEDEIRRIRETEELIINKIQDKSKKLNLLIRLVNDLKSDFEGDLEIMRHEKMIVD